MQKVTLGKICSCLGLLCCSALLVLYGLYRSGEATLRRLQVRANGQATPPLVFHDDTYVYNDALLNFLCLGIDTRGTLRKETDFSRWDAGQADAIYLLSLNAASHALNVVVLPRNTMVDLELYGEDGGVYATMHNQLCLQYGYAGGGDFALFKMKEKVSALLCGIPIHGCAALSLPGVTVAVDAIGGVDVTIPADMTEYNPNLLKGMRVRMDGKAAYSYLHYRDTRVLGSPLTRLDRQKSFLLDLVGQLKEKPVQTLSHVRELYHGLSPYMSIDISGEALLYLAGEALQCELGDASFFRPEGESVRAANQSGKTFDDFYADPDSLKEIAAKVFFLPAR